MTSFAMNSNVHSFINLDRQPRRSFAARLAALQARAENAELPSTSGVAARLALAAVPFTALVWLFVAV